MHAADIVGDVDFERFGHRAVRNEGVEPAGGIEVAVRFVAGHHVYEEHGGAENHYASKACDGFPWQSRQHEGGHEQEPGEHDARMGEHADAGSDEEPYDPFDEVFAGGERVEQAKCGVQPERQKRGGQAEGDQRTGSQHLEGVRGGSDGERGDDEREYRGE